MFQQDWAMLGVRRTEYIVGDIGKDFAMDIMNEATMRPPGALAHLLPCPVDEIAAWSIDVPRAKVIGRAIDFATGGGWRRMLREGLYFLALLPVMAFPPANAGETARMNIDGAVTITAEQLIEMAASVPDLVVIDARKQSDWERGHIDGTIHMVNTEMTEQRLAAVARRDQTVVFYCNGPKCYRSGDASEKAVTWGWKKIFWFRGGTEEWSERGYPLTK